MGRQEQASTGMRLLVARRITELGDPHILAPDPPALGWCGEALGGSVQCSAWTDDAGSKTDGGSSRQQLDQGCRSSSSWETPAMIRER